MEVVSYPQVPNFGLEGPPTPEGAATAALDTLTIAATAALARTRVFNVKGKPPSDRMATLGAAGEGGNATESPEVLTLKLCASSPFGRRKSELRR
jgi:hypothetical protein